MQLPIYMDSHATTPVDPRVLEEMLPFFTKNFGNAASRNHPFGWKAEEACDQARERVSALIGAQSKEMIFTSGATESNNLAIQGVAAMYRERGNHILTVTTEHKSVLDTCKHLERNGFQVTLLPVDRHGRVDPEGLKRAITDKTILISVMAANNEIGTIHPIAEIGCIAKEKGVIFHCDAAQAVGKIPIDVEKMGVDLLSISGHKIYGPKGIGALYVRRKNPKVRLAPILHGGGHEQGLRSGTLNVPGIVGLGKACELCRGEMDQESKYLENLRDRLLKGILEQLDEVYVNGHPTKRLPGNLNLSFAYVEGETLLMGIKNIAVSSGAACTSASVEPSHVLKAIGVREDLIHASIRFGLGRFNTQEEVDYTIGEVVRQVKNLRAHSPFYESVQEKHEKLVAANDARVYEEEKGFFFQGEKDD